MELLPRHPVARTRQLDAGEAGLDMESKASLGRWKGLLTGAGRTKTGEFVNCVFFRVYIYPIESC